MPVLLQITWITGCALALCIYVGWGATKLALPAALRPQAALFVPLIGYALTIWLGYLGVSSALNLRWSLVLLLILATILNLLAWRRGPDRAQRRLGLRELAAPIALGAITLLIGVLPLLHYGYATTIGEGWDTESYLPLAQHLNDYRLASIPEAPISPLRDLVSAPPRIGVTLGYSVLQGMTMLLSGQTALATFAPLLALLRALGVLAIYAWLRTTMGLDRWAALLGAALTSAGALLLWVSYFNFGMQLAAWPLLALGLALGIAAVEDLAAGNRRAQNHATAELHSLEPQSSSAAEPRNHLPTPKFQLPRLATALLAGVVLAALPVAYYPALTLWLPLALGLGAARIVEAFRRPQGPRPLALLLAALGLSLLTLLLAAPTIQDYFEGFSFRYSLPAEHVGPDRFIAISETIGLKAFRLPDDGAQPPELLIQLASVIAALLALAGLVLPAKNQEPIVQHPTPNTQHPTPDTLIRLRWLGVLGAALAYLAWLRFGRPYEYAYMKGSAYAGFLAWGVVALGAQALWQRGRLGWRAGIAGLGIILLATAAWAQALTISDHWPGPANFRRDVAAFDQAATMVPRGASVAITSDASFTGPTSGLFASMLYGREIWGHLSTAYSGLDYWPEGRLPQYALLAAGERAWPLDLGGRELWRSAAAALYQLDASTPALLGRAGIYSRTPVANKKSPAALEIWRRSGAYRAATPGTPLTILVGDSLRFGPGQPDDSAGPKSVQLTLATLVDQRAFIGYGATSEGVDLKAGINKIMLGLPGAAAVRIDAEQALALISAEELPRGSAQTSAQLDRGQIAWSALAQQRGELLQVQLRMANPGLHALRVGLTIVEDSFAQPFQMAQMLAVAPMSDTWQLSIAPTRGAAEARVGAVATPLLSLRIAPDPPNTRYFGVLELYDGAEVVAHAPVFTFALDQGKITQFTPMPFSVEATVVGRPAGALPSNRRALLAEARALDSHSATIEQAVLVRQPATPGDPADTPLLAGAPLTVQLFWRADAAPAPPLMVSLQVLGADNHKWAQWDGTLGGDWQPSQYWHAGEHVRQDVPLVLEAAIPPGTYRLALVVYDPGSGQPLPFGGQSVLELGDLVVR